MDSNFERAFDFTLKEEGGYINSRYDPGGETKFGISKRSYPHLDIPNLTLEEAKAIYYRDYWKKSGADKLRWPLSLIVFDTAVNSGVSVAKQLLKVSNDPEEYLSRRLSFYTNIEGWTHFGKGWARRMARLLAAASGADAVDELLDVLVVHIVDDEDRPIVDPLVFRGDAVSRKRDVKMDVKFKRKEV